MRLGIRWVVIGKGLVALLFVVGGTVGCAAKQGDVTAARVEAAATKAEGAANRADAAARAAVDAAQRAQAAADKAEAVFAHHLRK